MLDGLDNLPPDEALLIRERRPRLLRHATIIMDIEGAFELETELLLQAATNGLGGVGEEIAGVFVHRGY
jgi:hypothetical protein